MSAIPDAIDGVLAVLRASSALSKVDIIDGEPVTNTGKDFIAVGFAEDGGEVVTGDVVQPAMNRLLQDESFEIACRVSAWTGATNMKTVRDRAFTLFAAVEAALLASPTLSAAVTLASITREGYAQYQTEQGAVADIDFSVSVRSAHF